jgi:glucokinase
MKYVAAIDVGGTSIKAALVSSEFTIIDTAAAPTPKNDSTGAQTAEIIATLIHAFEEKKPVSAIGLAVPGALDELAGTSRWSGNLGWKNVPIRDLVSKKTGKPVAFGHDVRTGMVAEMRNGAAKGFANSIFIPIGTGIAAALVIDSAIRSADGFAGEIGHVNVGHNRLCVCGKNGCLEAISSANSIGENYRDISGKSATSEEIFNLAKIGDVVALKVWEEAIYYLAIACEQLITILSPEAIIFGGGVSIVGNELIDPLTHLLKQRLTFQRMPELLIAHYGAQAGTIGCAMLALDAAESQ